MGKPHRPFAHMRFLYYREAGDCLAPHVDLFRTSPTGERSTHTLLVYLTGGDACSDGGDTVLLRSLEGAEHLASCSPYRGRILLFPHLCPHLAEPVVVPGKLVLRGECW